MCGRPTPSAVHRSPTSSTSCSVSRPTSRPSNSWTSAKRVERALGREREVRWGPRTIDIDLLLFGDQQMNVPLLTVPHPRMTSRGFVLLPAAGARSRGPLARWHPAGRHPARPRCGGGSTPLRATAGDRVTRRRSVPAVCLRCDWSGTSVRVATARRAVPTSTANVVGSAVFGRSSHACPGHRIKSWTMIADPTACSMGGPRPTLGGRQR